MRVLIIGAATTNGLRALGVEKQISGGGWVENLINNMAHIEDIKLFCAFYYAGIDKIISSTLDNVTYLALPAHDPTLNSCTPQMGNDLEKLALQVRPDICHIIGTEREYNYELFKIIGKEKCLISITGLVSICAKHYFGGIPYKAFLYRSIGDILRNGGPIAEQKRFRKMGLKEQKLISEAQYIMGRTTWDYACVKQINSKCNYIYCGEILNSCYINNKWSVEKAIQHRIFVSQGSYPLKGLHKLLEAFPLVLRQYPDAEIFVAGADILKAGTLLEWIKQTTYAKYLKRLIKKLGIQSKIHFTGPLNAKGMLEQYLSCNVFVLPSAIENSPNSLGEAMSLGVPCVAACVGGVQDMLKDKEEGFIYPFDETYMLAHYINYVFESPELLIEMGERAQKHAKSRFDTKTVVETTIDTYKMIMERSK